MLRLIFYVERHSGRNSGSSGALLLLGHQQLACGWLMLRTRNDSMFYMFLPEVLVFPPAACRQRTSISKSRSIRHVFFRCVSSLIRKQTGGHSPHTHPSILSASFLLFIHQMPSHSREKLRAGAARVSGGGVGGLADARVGRAGEAVHGTTGVSCWGTAFRFLVFQKVPLD